LQQQQALIPSNPIPQRGGTNETTGVTAEVLQQQQHSVSAATEITKSSPDKVDIPVISYFNNQNSFNTSLSKELNELREMYSRLESK
jgi:phage-related minor tail protein